MIRVLVVDDSAVVRKIMTDQLSRFDDIEIIGTAVDPYVAREKIVARRPDVITLDLEMPRMDGLSFLVRLMKHYPVPVVVLGSLTPCNSELAHTIRSAAQASIKAVPRRVNSTPPCVPFDWPVQTPHKGIAIGASTGGTKALESVLSGLPASAPGMVIVQHMPEKFTTAFAERLDAICPVRVKEAESGDSLVPGLALIAPGDRHMVLHRRGATYTIHVNDGPRVHYQRPSVDALKKQQTATNATERRKVACHN